MKYAIVLPDGAADEPVAELDGHTPLEAARTPNIDWIAANGRQGLVVTVPRGFTPGSDVATLSLFGYDPKVYHTGRAPLEAAAQGIATGPDQLIFRCNFVTIIDSRMEDFTAGHISQAEANRLIADLNQGLTTPDCCFYTGVSYRNLLIATVPDSVAPQCTPPHDIPGEPVSSHLPKGAGAAWVREIMDQAHAILDHHEVNDVRRDLGENPATDIWLWGQGKPPSLESFHDRFGITGSVVAAVDLIRGIARTIGLELIDVPGATGYLDTDYAAKGQAAVSALDRFDLSVVHVEAPDEAGHLGDANAKVEAIEQIDELVVGPLLKKLRDYDDWRILVAPDHPTPVRRKTHTSTPPPFCMAGSTIQALHNRPFSERAAEECGLLIEPGHEIAEYFLRK